MADNSYDLFAAAMRNNYQVSNLVGVKPAQFRKKIDDLLDMRDGSMEGYVDEQKQRDLSIRFHWGHDHDFGDFAVKGRMGDRHLAIPAQFHDRFQALPIDLSGKKILDIGVWTGGTSLLFCALGADVVAVEEVKKYARTVAYLKKAFAIEGLRVLNRSLYQLNNAEFYDQFDYAFFSGVIYHVTDPILALRIVFNALKDGGTCLVETSVVNQKKNVLSYRGPQVIYYGQKEDLSRGGWDWFVPSPSALTQMMSDVGFQDVQVGPADRDSRLCAVGRRTAHCDILRAGLSVRTVR